MKLEYHFICNEFISNACQINDGKGRDAEIWKSNPRDILNLSLFTLNWDAFMRKIYVDICINTLKAITDSIMAP